MEYGEFNSINTSLVEYERTTKRVPKMKSLDADKKSAKSEKSTSTAVPEKEEVIDFCSLQ